MHTTKIVEIFSQLQEGFIEEMSLIEGSLNLKIECIHLANQLESNYKYFYVVLKNTKDVYFLPWDDEDMSVSSLKDIQLFRPDILNVEQVDNDYIKIYSNCENVYSGGCIYILATDIIVFDEALNEIQLKALNELSDKYWFSSYKAE